ncbi:hypothetical protein MtrunA17_Chr7g0243061 [Medicago truncatula]|uniref:Uncharacterized protein n=1 Tax=Medicago truncatula TaxID=3880 RepID=A0A396H6C4_MEDTR|nr:hypothetical protein MtrunA17_Chr7g0243061 [Medicago truncatula]
MSFTPSMCKFSSFSFSFPLKKSICCSGFKPVLCASSFLTSPKED